MPFEEASLAVVPANFCLAGVILARGVDVAAAGFDGVVSDAGDLCANCPPTLSHP